jgi:Ca-activated chloride channel family protein
MRGLTLLLCLAPLAGQKMAPIRVEVNLVNVGFTVRDAAGALAPNLKQDDFEVLEDGTPQKVSFFARSADVPLALGLILDVSGSQDRFLKPHHDHLDAFLKQVLGPADRAFLLCFGNHLRLVSDFTADRGQILASLKSFEHGNRDYPELARDDTRSAGTAFYDALYHATTEKLAIADRGRKALIMFSDGEDNSSEHHLLDAIEAAQTADARIYGLRYTHTRNGRWSSRNKYGRSVMARIARDTGASDFDVETGEIRTWFRAIAEELRSSYELAYTSTNPERDGTFRKLTIRPKQPGLTVRAKAGYYAR